MIEEESLVPSLPHPSMPRQSPKVDRPLSFAGSGIVTDSGCSLFGAGHTSACKDNDNISKQRTAHREARLIDGAIFSSQAGKLQKKDCNLPDSVPGSPSARSSPVRLSWSGGRQNPQLRQSWLQGVRSRLHQNKQRLSDRIQHSASTISHAGHSTIMSRIHRRVAGGDIRSSSPRPFIRPAVGLDGACDDCSPSRTSSNLDKPLPPEPEEDRATLAYLMQITLHLSAIRKIALIGLLLPPLHLLVSQLCQVAKLSRR